MEQGASIFVAGHRGLVGSALVRRLKAGGWENLLLRTHAQLNLEDGHDVDAYFAAHRPTHVFMAAARVGGIHANNTYGGDFLRQNLLIQTHVVEAARKHGAKKLLFLGSSCIYPRLAPQPMHEDALLTGPLEATNEPYAIAKIAGIKMVQAYGKQFGMDGINVMPTNLYGPGDNFDLENAHVLPALLRRFHEAKLAGQKSVTCWGSGKPMREFLHVDDLADACVHLMQHHTGTDPINVGTGVDITIGDLAGLIAKVVGYQGELVWDASKPDGTPRKLLDVSRMTALGWKARISLEQGLESTYRWFLEQDHVRG